MSRMWKELALTHIPKLDLLKDQLRAFLGFNEDKMVIWDEWKNFTGILKFIDQLYKIKF